MMKKAKKSLNTVQRLKQITMIGSHGPMSRPKKWQKKMMLKLRRGQSTDLVSSIKLTMTQMSV